MQIQEPLTNKTLSSITPDPSAIMQIGTGFWASKVLLSAIKLRLFTYLGSEAKGGEAIKQELGLHPRSLYDFLDALTALGLLQREGLLEEALYSNTPHTAFYLDQTKPSYIGGILEMCNDRLYPFWDTLEEGLITGAPQNEAKHSDQNLFEALYTDPQRLEQFLEAMIGIQSGAFRAFAQSFNFGSYKTLCDIGGATGILSIYAALNNPHLQCTTFDLPAVEPVAKKWIEKFDLTQRIKIQNGDFFKDPLPKADIITMGNILHDWGYKDKLQLAKAAYDALPEDGAFVVIESIIDDNRNQNVFGLLMSLNMLIETREGYDFTFSDFKELCQTAGFRRFELLHLAGPTSAAIAYK